MSITKSTFDHWMVVAAAASNTSAVTGQPATKPVVPQPPDFSACIAQLRKTTPSPAAGQPAPTTAQFKAQCQQQYTSMRTQVLGFLISADWVIGEANDQKVVVKDADVQKQFNTIKQQQFPTATAFQTFLNQSQQTVPDLLLRVKLQLLASKLTAKATQAKSHVTDAQVAAYYNANLAKYAQPERRDIRLILTKTQAQAQAAKTSIQHGQSFATVAKRVSIDPATKGQGGQLLGVARGQQEPQLDAALFAAARGVLSGPIKTSFGYYIFQVTNITPATQQTLAQAAPTIKSQLSAQQSQTALTSFVKGFQKKWTSRTDCTTDYVVMDCKQFKAPKTPAVGATTTP